MVTTDELATVPLFDSASDADLEGLTHLFEARDVSEGVELTGEGAPGYSFFILLDGSAAVTAHGETVAQIGPGDFFGETAIIEGSRRNATVTTTSPSRLLVMFGTQFRRLEMTQPGIAARIEDVMRQRLAAPQ
jgi:CRP-like cAMP-binding protein